MSIGLLAATAAFAGSAGKLDRSFGRHGVVVVRNIHAPAAAAAVGRHNRVVAVSGRHGAFAITRTLPNGDIENDFGNRGVVTVRFGSNAAQPTSVAIGRKGWIVVAGTVCSDASGCHLGVARLRPNGDLNRHFGDDGTVEINFPTAPYLEPSVALATGGRIVVAGSADEPGTYEWSIALAALQSDGSLDPRFGEGGKVVSSFAPAGHHCKRSYFGFVKGMALDPHDRIVVDGECLRDGRAAVARFKRSGELDPSFGGNGLVNRKLGIFRVQALAVDKRDRIDVIGDRGTRYAVARLRTNGGLDRSFGRGGRVQGRWGHGGCGCAAGVRSGAIDSRGRIIVGGSHSHGFAFARFKHNGHPDRRFGHRGRVVVHDPRRDFHFSLRGTVAVDRRDRIIGSGIERHVHDSRPHHLAVVRLCG